MRVVLTSCAARGPTRHRKELITAPAWSKMCCHAPQREKHQVGQAESQDYECVTEAGEATTASVEDRKVERGTVRARTQNQNGRNDFC